MIKSPADALQDFVNKGGSVESVSGSSLETGIKSKIDAKSIPEI